MGIFGYIVGILFCIVSVLLILIILLQRGRGGGLAGAFGGVGGQSAFGAKTGDVFTWITVVLTGVFLVIAVVMVYAMQPQKYTNITEIQSAGTTASQPAEKPAASQPAN
jgi:preprotein translocase subunit SecG